MKRNPAPSIVAGTYTSGRHKATTQPTHTKPSSTRERNAAREAAMRSTRDEADNNYIISIHINEIADTNDMRK